MTVAARTWTPELDAKVAALIAKRLTAAQIAGRLGLTRNQVCGRASRLGLKILGSRSPAETRAGWNGRRDRLYGRLGMRSQPSGCRFIEGDPRERDSRWCDQPQRPGSSFCPEHHSRCWVKSRHVA